SLNLHSFPTRRSSDLVGVIRPGNNRIPWIHFNAAQVSDKQQALYIITYQVVNHFVRRRCIYRLGFHPGRRKIAGVFLVKSFIKRSEEHTSELQSRENL